MKRLVVLAGILLAFLGTGGRAEPIFEPGSPFLNLFSDQSARQIGDILNIKIAESVTRKNTSTAKTDKSFNIPVPTGGGFLHFVNRILNGLGSSRSNSDRQFQDSDTLTTTFAVKVVAVEPNGNLRVEGTHEVVVNNEKRMVVLSGMVRPKDIDSLNTVSSTQVADLKVDMKGVGKSPGILTRILRVLF